MPIMQMTDGDLDKMQEAVNTAYQKLTTDDPLAREDALALLSPTGWVCQLIRDVRQSRQ